MADKNEDLIREIREDYSYFRDFWRENYEEAKVDLRYVAGDPWEASDRQEREGNGRPVLCPDELEQYLNQAINNLRQNPLGIKVEPKGNGATDKNAERRQAIIRNVEYDSVAQAAYTNAYSCAMECGFGFFRISTKKISKDGEVEPRIKIIDNPLSVLMDPNAKEADYSDQKRCFVIDKLRKSDFARLYPKAQKRSFSVEDSNTAPDWFEAENVIVAEYWRIDGYDEDGEGGKVTQYITNGVEILDTREWAGSRIPIIPVLGKTKYVPKGGKVSRMYYSMIRKARGAQMMMAYIASQEAEEYGMAPRAPFVGYVGQFETDKDSWDTLNKVPRAYVQVDPIVDESSNQILPLPTRPAFIPNAQAYEIGKESWRRSIQSSMGIMPLPTSAQRQNEKSGVALERIQTQQSVGAYHFTANFKLSLQNAGWQINELITNIIDTPRQIAGRGQDDTQKLIPVAPKGLQPITPLQPGEEPFDPAEGEFDVTISSGPSYQSQREAASEFADLVVQQVDRLPIPPPAKAKLVSMSIKLKNIGPLGDEMAEIIDPPQDQPIPPQFQQMAAQMQHELQFAKEMGAKLFQRVQELEFDQKAQLTKHQGDVELQKMKSETEIAKAEITTKAQDLSERMAVITDMFAKLLDQSHEFAMQQQEQQHAKELAAQQAQQQSALADQNAANASAQSANDAAQQPQVSQ